MMLGFVCTVYTHILREEDEIVKRRANCSTARRVRYNSPARRRRAWQLAGKGIDMTLTEVQRNGYTISTDPGRLDLDAICSFMSRSYWANERPRETTQRAIEHSLCFGVYDGDQQIGFARVVTDYATFAWLADVFIAEEVRGRGLGKWLVEVVLSHPELQSVPRWFLATRDAHGLYRRFGFTELKAPERRMELNLPSARG
jgi:GNAT superfamily N-acetyltransferase